jgi:hypothetical protein
MNSGWVHHPGQNWMPMLAHVGSPELTFLLWSGSSFMVRSAFELSLNGLQGWEVVWHCGCLFLMPKSPPMILRSGWWLSRVNTISARGAEPLPSARMNGPITCICRASVVPQAWHCLQAQPWQRCLWYMTGTCLCAAESACSHLSGRIALELEDLELRWRIIVIHRSRSLPLTLSLCFLPTQGGQHHFPDCCSEDQLSEGPCTTHSAGDTEPGASAGSDRGQEEKADLLGECERQPSGTKKLDPFHDMPTSKS